MSCPSSNIYVFTILSNPFLKSKFDRDLASHIEFTECVRIFMKFILKIAISIKEMLRFAFTCFLRLFPYLRVKNLHWHNLRRYIRNSQFLKYFYFYLIVRPSIFIQLSQKSTISCQFDFKTLRFCFQHSYLRVLFRLVKAISSFYWSFIAVFEFRTLSLPSLHEYW
jgi:hypothetical protein